MYNSTIFEQKIDHFKDRVASDQCIEIAGILKNNYPFADQVYLLSEACKYMDIYMHVHKRFVEIEISTSYIHTIYRVDKATEVIYIAGRFGRKAFTYGILDSVDNFYWGGRFAVPRS